MLLNITVRLKKAIQKPISAGLKLYYSEENDWAWQKCNGAFLTKNYCKLCTKDTFPNYTWESDIHLSCIKHHSV